MVEYMIYKRNNIFLRIKIKKKNLRIYWKNILREINLYKNKFSIYEWIILDLDLIDKLKVNKFKK